MTPLIRYQDFLKRVEELGFMPLSTLMEGFPSLSAETPERNWHMGDPDVDPWVWKDRAAEEKALAYGCILNGHKGFVSKRLYSVFFAAYNPVMPIEELWESGQVDSTTWELWQLFENKGSMNTSEIRAEMGVTAKKGGSRVDSSLQDLQKLYYITIAGNKRKVDKTGRPYGWPACVYEKVFDWAPTEWLRGVSDVDPTDARKVILEAGMAIGKGVRREELARVFGL